MIEGGVIRAQGSMASLRPLLASYAVAMGGHGFRAFWVDFALVSRLYNPEDELPITYMTDRQLGNSSAATAMQDASIRLVPIQDYSGPGSRGNRLTTEAARLFQRFHEIMVPTHTCAKNDSLHLAECTRISMYRIPLIARFCWQADLANVEGAEYVVSSSDCLHSRLKASRFSAVRGAWN